MKNPRQREAHERHHRKMTDNSDRHPKGTFHHAREIPQAHLRPHPEHDRLDDLDARVAHTLADMLHPQLYPNRECRIEISNEELGHLVGASRQRINQALQELVKSGLITMGYRIITVLNIEGLRDFGTRLPVHVTK